MILTHNAAFSNKVSHGFYGREGGVSTGIYASLNCRSGTGDDLAAVIENRRRVGADLGVPVDKVISVAQCHGPDCVILQGPETHEMPIRADALATDMPGRAISVLTADCGPVLFEGTKADGRPVIGAAHAGWGGAVKGVLETTLTQMKALGAVPESIRACVGPCIGPASYEVSEGFDAPFMAHNPESERFFKGARKPGHMMFDLPGYIGWRLALAGVSQVSLSGIDTYKEPDHCFSYRRATHEGQGDYGRQISAMVINGEKGHI